MSDPHKLLGLEQSASRVELDAAFRRLAKSCHPDRNREDPKAAERFRQLRAAYEGLRSGLNEGGAPRPDVSSMGGYRDDSYRSRRGPDVSSIGGYRDDSYRSRRGGRVLWAIKRAMIQVAIVLSFTFPVLLIFLYILWANTQTDWIPGCC